MASASEQLYDTSSPISYDQWRDNAISEWGKPSGSFWKDFWNGFSGWPKLLNPNDSTLGRKGYQDYLDDFYNKQEIKNAEIAEKRERDYETYMSNTAYQRAYQDIKATGLNPALLLTSAFGSASTPSSAAAYNRSSSRSSSRSESESKSKSLSASAILAALIYLIAHI